jgi:hypothetical protein
VTEVHEVNEPTSLKAVEAAFDWTDLRIYDVNVPGLQHSSARAGGTHKSKPRIHSARTALLRPSTNAPSRSRRQARHWADRRARGVKAEDVKRAVGRHMPHVRSFKARANRKR